MIPITLYPVLFTILFGAAVFLLAVSRMKTHSEAKKFVEDQCWMRVVKSIQGEFLHGTETLLTRSEFRVMRQFSGLIICQDFDTGKMFFMKTELFLTAVQQSRIERAKR